MGNSRFKFSDLFPSAWFFPFHHNTQKKKSKKKKKRPEPINPPSPHTLPPTKPHRLSHSRKSYYINRQKTIAECPPPHPPPTKPALLATPEFLKPQSSELHQRSDTTLPTESYAIFKNQGGGYDLIPGGEGLRRIVARHGRTKTGCRRVEAGSPPPAGVKVRAQSPRTRGGRRRSKRRRSMSWGSRAVVKESVEPERDFRESMKEMIMEKGIREGRDLEELLACYLSLNSPQYHPLIISAFTHTCFHHLSVSPL